VVHKQFWIKSVPTKSKQLLRASREPKSTRASVSFPLGLYETLERIAREQKVSVAWIVRDAAEKYVGKRLPSREKTN